MAWMVCSELNARDQATGAHKLQDAMLPRKGAVLPRVIHAASKLAHLVEEGMAAVLLPGLAKGGVGAGRLQEGAAGVGALLLHRAAAQRAAAHGAQAAAAGMAARGERLPGTECDHKT
jgi:hypothetical protein